MNDLQTHIKNYLEYCNLQKRLDEKTLKAYKIDLRQFLEKVIINEIQEITPDILEEYIASLHQLYKPKTVKKIASLKDFFHYLEYRDTRLTKYKFVFANRQYYLKQYHYKPLRLSL